jgi:hypothetical protein
MRAAALNLTACIEMGKPANRAPQAELVEKMKMGTDAARRLSRQLYNFGGLHVEESNQDQEYPTLERIWCDVRYCRRPRVAKSHPTYR